MQLHTRAFLKFKSSCTVCVNKLIYVHILDTGGLVIKHTWLSHTLYQAHNVPYTAKLLRGKTFAVVHKTHYSLETFTVHQAHAIMYCTWQVIQGENFCDWLKTVKVFPLKSFAVYGIPLRKFF